MKLEFIYPDDRFDVHFTLPTAAYEKIWNEDSDRIKQAFKNYTGLTFQQKIIKVKVYDGVSMSGTSRKPMRLNTQNRTLTTKRFALIHELGHRLLSENMLSALHQNDDERSDDEHRRLSLFESDVFLELYGKDAHKEWLSILEHGDTKTFEYLSSLSFGERQEKLRHLIATNELR